MSEHRRAGADTPGVRFEATVHTTARAADLQRVADLDVDRTPDPEGDGVRVLVDAEACHRLLDRGFEVRLRRAVPIRPLDPDLIASEQDVRAWFDDQVGDAERPGGS